MRPPQGPTDVPCPLLTYTEAAKVLCVTERTIRQFVADGKLPVVRFGRTVRIDPADLRAFINSAKRRDSGDAA